MSAPQTGLARPADSDLSDLTTAQRTGPAYWDEGDGMLVIPFAVEPSLAEQAAIRRRLLTADAVEESTVNSLMQARSALANDNTTHGQILRLLVNDRLRDIKEA